MQGCMTDYRDTEQSLEKKLHKTNQSSNFLGGSFSNRDNIRAQIQFRRESQTQHPKREQTHPYYINNTSVTRKLK